MHSRERKYSTLVLATDLPDIKIALGLITEIPVELWNKSYLQASQYNLDPATLYVFAFVANPKEIITFMAAKAGAPNFLAFCTRPGSEFSSTNGEMGKIILLSKESVEAQTLAAVKKALEIK